MPDNNKSNRVELSAFFEDVNTALAHVKLPAITQHRIEGLPLLFIIGAPRSGTTLLSQLMIKHLGVGYINNLIARFWKRPSVGIALTKALLEPSAQTNILLRSELGRSEQVAGPHEFAYFWRHWLPFSEAPNDVLPDKLKRKVDAAGLRACLENELVQPFGKPVLFKYLFLGPQADFLSAIYPSSLFIHIQRNKNDVIRSIIRARKSYNGNYDDWFSVRPSGWPYAGADVCEQVFLQVENFERDIRQSLANIKSEVLEIRYEALCLDPKAVLSLIATAISRHTGVRLFDDHHIPALTPRKEAPLEDTFERRLKELLGKEYEQA